MGGCCCRGQSAKVHLTTAATPATTSTTASKYAIDGEGPPHNTQQPAPSTKNPAPPKQKGGNGDHDLAISNLEDIPDEPSMEPLPPETGASRSKPPPGKMTPTASAPPVEDDLVPYEEEEDEREKSMTGPDLAEDPIKSAEDVLKGYSAQLKKKKAKSSANLIYAPVEQLNSRDNEPDPKEGQPPDLAATEGEAPKVFSRPF